MERRRFLKAIGHRPEHDLPATEGEPGAAGAAYGRRLLGNATDNCDNLCGWWWCKDTRANWVDLTKAVSFIKAHHIDPWGGEVRRVAWAQRNAECWADERKQWDAIHAALASLPPLSGGPSLARGELLSKLSEYTRGVSESRRLLPKQTGFRPALEAGRKLGWAPECVAAALLLTGVRKQSFSHMLKSVRMARLRDTQPLPQKEPKEAAHVTAVILRFP